MPDGRPFKDIKDFKQLLLADRDRVLRCLTEKLLIYSTGAGIHYSDRAEVTRITQTVTREGSGLRTLMHAVIQGGLFQNK